MSTINKVISFLAFVALVSSELHFSIYKLECIDEKDSNYTKNITCFIKTISRGLNVLTSMSDFVVPVDYMNGNIQVLQKASSNHFRNVIINNSVDVCELLGDNAPPLFKFCLPLLHKFSPNLVRPCPYKGRRVGVENLPIDLSLLPLVAVSNFPTGEYRIDVSFRDKWWNMIHWIKMYGSIQQKRFRKKHLGNSSGGTNDDTVD